MSDPTEDLQGKVALSCRILAMEGLVQDILGHVSARTPGRSLQLRDAPNHPHSNFGPHKSIGGSGLGAGFVVAVPQRRRNSAASLPMWRARNMRCQEGYRMSRRRNTIRGAAPEVIVTCELASGHGDRATRRGPCLRQSTMKD